MQEMLSEKGRHEVRKALEDVKAGRLYTLKNGKFIRLPKSRERTEYAKKLMEAIWSEK